MELLFYNRSSYVIRNIKGNGDAVAEMKAYLDFYYNACLLYTYDAADDV